MRPSRPVVVHGPFYLHALTAIYVYMSFSVGQSVFADTAVAVLLLAARAYALRLYCVFGSTGLRLRSKE